MSKRVSLILALASVLPVTASAPASAQSYPFTCQIGTMNGMAVGGGHAALTFTRSNGPAASGLQPGQCAFSDRAVKSSEPNSLCFPGTVTAIQFSGSTVVKGFFTAFSGPGSSVMQSGVFGPTKLMNFTVHNDGGGCMAVDSFGV